jgi:hypothetical protein
MEEQEIDLLPSSLPLCAGIFNMVTKQTVLLHGEHIHDDSHLS